MIGSEQAAKPAVTLAALPRGAAGLAAAVALMTFALAEPALATMRTIKDALGREVTIDAPAGRVVVMFNYEEFTAIAGADGWKRVVGINRAVWAGWRPAIWSRYVAKIPEIAEKPDVGSTDEGTFSAEKVIALKPDVLLMPQISWEATATARAQIEAAGIRIVAFDYNAQITERHAASTRAIGAVMGADARAEELASLYETKMADIQRRIASLPKGPKPKVYVEIGQTGAASVGNSYNGTMWGRILDNLGAENITNGRIPGPYGPLNPEYVLAANPEFIFIGGSSWVGRPNAVRLGYDATPEITRASLAPYAARPGWSDLKAIKAGEIHALEHGLARTLYDYTAQQYIAKRLYPAAFADVDPLAELAAYHAKYLPVPFSGTWALKLAP
ncbi:ABC transporter substrate-binding protein [Prosthecomicrobium hirschii]|uniref:ABC transporter substrate-binding protein n=1 Tax=Prosthecodimorpha hirschii TaxID=665126 RepID=UPI00221F0D9C|nr:ABC transporter substrate-binding protein [Prosthecomicrobium hirschii]